MVRRVETLIVVVNYRVVLRLAALVQHEVDVLFLVYLNAFPVVEGGVGSLLLVHSLLQREELRFKYLQRWCVGRDVEVPQ